MKFQQYLLLFLVALAVISCSQRNSDEQQSELSKYRIVKVDSFEVNNLTRISIRDFSQEENRYLGYSMVEDELLEVSKSGEIIKREKKKGDGPGLYGNWNPISISFGPNNERIVELPFQIIAYDSSYSVLHSQRIQSPLPIRTFGPLGRTEYFQNQDSTFYLVGPSNYLSAHYLILNEEGRDTLQNFYKIDIHSGNMKSVLPYRDSSPYRQTNDIYNELMTKSFVVNQEKKELLVLHGLSQEVEVYSLPDLGFKKAIPIQHQELLAYPPVPIGTPGNDKRITPLRFMAGRNQSLIQIDENTYLVGYFTGVTEAEYQTRIAEEATYIPSSDLKERFFILIKNGKQTQSDIQPIGGAVLFGLGDGKFLVQEPENQDIEEEITRFSIYQLKKN